MRGIEEELDLNENQQGGSDVYKEWEFLEEQETFVPGSNFRVDEVRRKHRLSSFVSSFK